MGVQIYCGVRMPLYTPPGEVEEDEMLDFADIGGVYDDASAGVTAANTSALQSFLSSRATSEGIQLMFSGNRLQSYNDRRQPGVAYLDVSAGPITYAPLSTTAGSLAVVGLSGARVVGQGAPSATSPLFDISRPVGGIQAFTFHNLQFENGLGSGIKFNAPGARTEFAGCNFRQMATAVASPVIDYDGWTDLDTAAYGLKFEEADGGFLYNCSFQNIAGHGLIAKRWHEGVGHFACRECEGDGFKGEQVQGTSINLRSESNLGWGMHVRDCGNQVKDGASSTRGEEGTANAWEIWCEANNDRGADGTYTAGSGYRYRQIKVDSSSRLTIGGHSGWASGKVAVSEATRRTVRLVEQDWIDPSPGDSFATLVYDLNNDGADLTDHNWDSAWGVSDRPTLTSLGDTGSGTYELQLDIVAGSYDTTVGGAEAWWRPIPSGVTLPTISSGDKLMWSVEMSTDAGGAAYCSSREALAYPTPRMPAYLGSWTLTNGDANRAFALWNQARMKFSNRMHYETSAGSIGLQMYQYFTGMGDTGEAGVQYPESSVQIRIHSLKLYRITG